ncbi:putative iron-sulfur cluster-binding rieske family domain protein [Phaeomoniella chlamydospora]|uniref:Putative iron-sulfur cluster-binding rieske family domain protein n=1 Tax=Phaeomoniella chlamydospora TaxID=158046 RepID=A0A0G2DRK7_PHACM|nr:putative iron-sulfur cluster-binding rieske family domain protein [Phaeomoniella chlamydospora]
MHGASRHYLPPKPSTGFSEAYITWLYPLGVITFSENLLFIGRFTANSALNTSYDSETYRRKSRIPSQGPIHDEWMEHEIAYWRLVEKEDVELAIDAQKGFRNGVLARGRLHSVEEHAVKWYQDKVRGTLIKHTEMERQEGKIVDYAIPEQQRNADQDDELCRLMGPEFEW